MSSEQTQHEYVTLVSGDGFEYIIPRSTACVSGTIRRMLDPSSQFLPSRLQLKKGVLAKDFFEI